MSRIKSLWPGKAAAALPIERIIQIGRRTGPRSFPERLDRFMVSHTRPDPKDAAGNREEDREITARLLQRQREIAPEEPPDKLRAIEVFVAPAGAGGDAGDSLGSDFLCRTEDRAIICRGNGDTALWTRDVLPTGKIADPPGVLRALTEWGPNDPAVEVECRGLHCPYYGRTTPDGKKQIHPRCGLEWSLRVQIAALESVFGVARYQSASSHGYEETAGVVEMLEQLATGGRIPGIGTVPVQLRLKNITTGHGKSGAWIAYLHAPGTALALIEAADRAYSGGRQLGAGAPVMQLAAGPGDEKMTAARADACDDADVVDAEVEPDAVEARDVWDVLTGAAREIAGDDAVAKAAMAAVIKRSADLGLPAWAKGDGQRWEMTADQLEAAERAIEEEIFAAARAAADAAQGAAGEGVAGDE